MLERGRWCAWRRGSLGRVSFVTCDAERVDEAFEPQTFDLVFSSNMLEHLPDPGRALRAMRTVMQDDGIAIHVVPSPFWKTTHLLGFYVNAIVGRLDRRLRRAGTTGPDAAAGSAAGADGLGQQSEGGERPALVPGATPVAGCTRGIGQQPARVHPVHPALLASPV